MAVLALTAAAVLAKEHAAVLPAVFLLADGCFLPRSIASNWRLYIPLGASAAAGAAWLAPQLAAADSAGLGAAGLPALSYLVTQGRVVWIYLRMLVLPVGQSLDHGYPFFPASDPLGLLGLAALAALAVFAFLQRRRFPALAFGILTALLLLAPTSSFLPIRDALVERRMYLPFLGVCIAATAVAAQIRLSRRAGASLAAGLLLACSAATYARNRLWSGAVAMWEDAVRKNPAHPRAQFHLGYAYYQAGRCADAAQAYARTARLATPEFRLLFDWSLALGCAGRPAEAEWKLRAAAAALKPAPATRAPGPAGSPP
jgi:hypothetical protein